MPRRKKASTLRDHLLTNQDVEDFGLDAASPLDFDSDDFDSRLDEHEILTGFRRVAHIGEFAND
jgi:hypothetical protein